MYKHCYEVEVLINGKPAKEFAHEGKTYIEGREGTTFSLKLRNNSYTRKLFVPTIDGLSVIDGKEASYKSNGYIVQGNSSITVDGWRRSDKEVAEFYFSSPEGSYRKRMKQGDNLGVIGVAVFDEKPQYNYTSTWPTWTYTISTPGIFNVMTDGSGNNIKYQTTLNEEGGTSAMCCSTNAAMCCSTNAAMQNVSQTPAQKLGTGWGETKHSEVTSVSFDVQSYPETTFELFYNTREELEKLGINFHKTPLYVAPQAFPGQYCKPPQE